MFRRSIDLCYVGMGWDDDYGRGGGLLLKLVRVCVCVSMYSCLTFKLFDEKNSSLPRAEYESSRTNRRGRKYNIVFCAESFRICDCTVCVCI